MKPEKKNIIGIVGGMGPQAGIALVNNILKHSDVRSDQEHLSFVLMSFPADITDRTLFLEGRSLYNPAYSVASVIDKLNSAGANIIGIACNTCHAPEIMNVILEETERKAFSIKLLNMPVETCRYISEHYFPGARIGIMGTNGTYKSGFYSKLLEELGYKAIVPDPAFQAEVIHEMIYSKEFGLKSNTRVVSHHAKKLFKNAEEYFLKAGVETIILACTELSLFAEIDGFSLLPLVDSLDVLSRALIREAVCDENINKVHNTESFPVTM
jgi:aspartate racemase